MTVRRIVVERLELAEGPDQEVGVPLDEVPGRHVGVRAWRARMTRSSVRFRVSRAALVDVDQDLPDVGGEDLGRGDAVDALQPRRHLVLEELLQLRRPAYRR